MLARVDFRKGSLIGEGGFDSVSGSGAAITETDTGVGIYAADRSHVQGLRVWPERS